MRSLKVLLVTTSYPLAEGETSGIFVRRMVRRLPSRIRVEVLTPAARGAKRAVLPEGITVIPFRYAPRRWEVLAHGPGGIPQSLRGNPWRRLLLPPFLASLLFNILARSRGADLIHANWTVNGAAAGLAGRLRGVPVLTTLRGEDVNRARSSRLYRLALRLCLALSARAVTVNRSLRDRVAGDFPEFAAKIAVIENGVDEEFLLAGEGRDYRRRGEGPLRAVMVGSLIPVKSVETAVEAAGILRERCPVALDLAGTGPEEGRLRELADRLGLGELVSFRGAVPPERIPGILRDSDLFLLTSRREGRPNSLLEAMAAGLPVIASNIEGAGEIITDGRNGLLFEEGSARGLAGRLEKAAGDAALREGLGRRARAWIMERGLLWTRTAEQYALLYEELAGENRRP